MLVYCACGCGQQRENVDSRGRQRTYINYHGCKGTSEKKSLSKMGSKNPMYGKGGILPTYGFHITGSDHSCWKGGKKLARQRSHTKRRRLGNDLINECISDDMVAHHLTKDYVAYVPEFINKSCYHNIYTGLRMDEVNFYTLNYLLLVYNGE